MADRPEERACRSCVHWIPPRPDSGEPEGWCALDGSREAFRCTASYGCSEHVERLPLPR